MSPLDAWAVSWELWAAAGLVLVVLDLVVGGSGNIIAFGVACFLMSMLAAAGQATGVPLVPGWKAAALEFAIAAALAVVGVRMLWNKGTDHDVNKY